jgi:hypothetical protein
MLYMGTVTVSSAFCNAMLGLCTSSIPVAQMSTRSLHVDSTISLLLKSYLVANTLSVTQNPPFATVSIVLYDDI